MGKNNLLWLAAGAMGVYLLMPEKVKEVISGAGGGGVGITMPGINLGGLVPNITMPAINISGLLGGTSAPGISDVIPETGAIADTIAKAKTATEAALASAAAAGKVVIPEGSKISETKDVFGNIKTDWAKAFFKWQENVAAGVEGGISAFDWITGGWQEKNTMVGKVAEALTNFFDPHHTQTLTQYSRNILASRSTSPTLKDTFAPVTEKNPTTKPPVTSGDRPAITSQEQLSSLPMYVQREYW